MVDRNQIMLPSLVLGEFSQRGFITNTPHMRSEAIDIAANIPNDALNRDVPNAIHLSVREAVQSYLSANQLTK